MISTLARRDVSPEIGQLGRDRGQLTGGLDQGADGRPAHVDERGDVPGGGMAAVLRRAIRCQAASDSARRRSASAVLPQAEATRPWTRLMCATSVAGKSLGPTGLSATPRSAASAWSGSPARTRASASRRRVAAWLTGAPRSRARVSSVTASPGRAPPARAGRVPGSRARRARPAPPGRHTRRPRHTPGAPRPAGPSGAGWRTGPSARRR